MFPIFDEGHKDFNPHAVSKTLTSMKGYQLEGMPADDAFVAALADTIDLYNLVTESQGDEDAEGEDKDKKKVVTKKAVSKKERKKQVEKARKTQKQQGKSPQGEGKGSADVGAAVPNIDDMTDEEIDALPAETLSRLRGDFV